MGGEPLAIVMPEIAELDFNLSEQFCAYPDIFHICTRDHPSAMLKPKRIERPGNRIQ